MERCTVCGRRAEENEKFTHLTLYVNGSEGTNACEDCRMDITNFVRNLSSSMNRASRRVRKEAKGIGFGELIKTNSETAALRSGAPTITGRINYMADTAEKPKTKRVELLFTHCWSGYDDLPFATKGPEAQKIKGQKVRDLKWLQEEIEDETLDEWTLENLQLGDYDGDDEVVVYATLKEAV